MNKQCINMNTVIDTFKDRFHINVMGLVKVIDYNLKGKDYLFSTQLSDTVKIDLAFFKNGNKYCVDGSVFTYTSLIEGVPEDWLPTTDIVYEENSPVSKEAFAEHVMHYITTKLVAQEEV